MKTMETDLKFKYGESVCDTVTGYKGKVTGFAYYYEQLPCSYRVEGIDTTGRPIAEWVDQQRLVKTEG